MGHDFTLNDRIKGSKRGLKTRQKKAQINYENKLIDTLQKKEIDKANDIYRKGKLFELLNNLPENQKKKYIVQKKEVNENLNLVLQKIFNITLNKD
jgi:hypothetical protein